MKSVKNIISNAAILLTALFTFLPAQGDLSLTDRFQLKGLMSKERKSRANDNAYVSGFIKIKPGETLGDIEKSGVICLNRIGDILLVSMPADSVISISNMKGVEGLQLGRKLKPMLNKARLVGNVDAVQAGNWMEGVSGYDGQGIFVSIFDSGVEPNNPNFNGRVEVIFSYSGDDYTNPSPAEYYGEDVKNFTTDVPDATHGTHVLGILTGNAPVLSKFYSETNAGLILNTNAPNPFYGVATGANVGVGCGQELYDTYIVDGVKRLIEYGTGTGLPVVVNISLGNNLGPHDNTDYCAAAFTELGKKANIFISSGNEADEDIALTKTFTDSTPLKTFFIPEDGTRYDIDEEDFLYVEIWGNNRSNINPKLVVAEKNGNIISTQTIKMAQDSISLKALFPDDFTSGYVLTQAGVNSGNNRFNAVIYSGDIVQKAGSNLYLGLEVDGKAGQRADVFTNGNSIYFSGQNIQGWTTPNGEMSVNSLACGDNTIAVGAMVSRVSWPGLSGYIYGYVNNYGTVDSIAPFSSFGTLVNGKKLPDFVAPGMGIVSSLNSYYTRNSSQDEIDRFSGELIDNKTTYYWGSMAGTSMAAPFAAGVGALWQQANKEQNGKYLSTAEILDIAQKNIIRNKYYYGPSQQQWGEGIIDALGGIRYILTGTSDLGKVHLTPEESEKAFLLILRNREVSVSVAGATELTVEIISLTGQKLFSTKVANNNFTQNFDNIASGIYLLKVVTPEGGHYTRKLSFK